MRCTILSSRDSGTSPVLDRSAELREVLLIRLFLVEPSICRCRCAVHGPPVRHHKTREGPVALEHLVHQIWVLAVIRAIGQVVRAHHRLHICICHADLEGEQIAFTPAAIVNDGVRSRAARLLIVKGKVLDIGNHVLILNCL
jgi:hypothetical protein